MKKDKAPRNKTIELTKAEINQYAKKTLKISAPIALDFVILGLCIGLSFRACGSA